MNKKRKGIILSILGLIGLVIITAGVTYAFFNYVKQGTTENTVTTGTITFLYTEIEANGAGISIIDALPMSDEQGKAQTGVGNVFNFKVQANTMQKSAINYEVTARKKDTSTLDEEAVKLYLTEVNGDTETEILLDNYSNLTQTSVLVPDDTVEKTIYTGKVPSDTQGYEKNFRLRLWLDESIDFSPVKDENGNDAYPYNGKTFTVTVNVYANAKVITTEEVAYESNTGIKTVLANEASLVEETDSDYDYMTTFANEVTSIELAIEPENEDAIVEVTKIEDTVALSDTSIKRLSSKKTFTFDLEEEDNLFKVVVTSANKKTSSEYIINIYREPLCPYDVGQTWTYNYSGSAEVFTTPCAGIYKIETYGASGQGINSQGSTRGGGLGTYVFGNIELERDFEVNMYIGGKGATNTAGYNGGGSGTSGSGGGGGATDIRINGTDISNRILVAGGGGGGPYFSTRNNPYDIETIEYGNAVGTLNSTLGQGTNGKKVTYSSYYFASGGGGGGYYGGYSNATLAYNDQRTWQGGGSSYIDTNYFFNYSNDTKSDITYTGTNGQADFTSSNVTYYNNSGDGKIIITLMSK